MSMANRISLASSRRENHARRFPARCQASVLSLAGLGRSCRVRPRQLLPGSSRRRRPDRCRRNRYNSSHLRGPMPERSRPALSHYDDSGKASMVDVSAKAPTRRTATASAFVDSPRLSSPRSPESQRRSARGGAFRRNPGSQAHFRADTHVPPPAADSRRCAGPD